MKCPLLELLYSPLKISFEDFSGFFCSFFFCFFFISWLVSWCNRSVSSTAVLPRETQNLSREWDRFIYSVWIFHTRGWGFAMKRVSEAHHYTIPHKICPIGHLMILHWTKLLISHEKDQLTTLKYWLMKQLSLSLRALLEPYPDWWYQNNTDFKHFKFIAYITPS